MTHTEMVEQALRKVKNVSGGATIDALFEAVNGIGTTTYLTRTQIKRVLKKVKGIALTNDSDVVRVKGRFVKPVLDNSEEA